MDSSMKICIIGGGAAGMMAAGTAFLYGADVTIFESMPFLGKKLAITGKGRCNVTNNSGLQELLDNITKNPRFLYSALSTFTPEDAMAMFENLGVPLKTERGNRVYPQSDKAKDIVDAMRRYCEGANVIHEKVKKISVGDNGGFLVKTDKEYHFDKVILATGGKSYPLTGSDGSGYRLATSLGHKVTELIPSLIPLNSPSELCPDMQGLSLKNVSIKVLDNGGNVLYTDFGEMMFTHFGMTGPMILSASAHIPDAPSGRYEARINLKPALDEKTLDARIISDFNKYANKDFLNALSDLLPQKLIPVAISLSGIDERKKVNSITKEERHALVDVIRCLRISISGFRPINEAIVTKGGVAVKEISPKTMESKLCRGLYFAGEVIDVDAYTGGFNLQIAFSTGVLAGESAAFASFE